MKIGLLGGSFNPAHRGHLRIAHSALRTLGLDQVWLMVSPGNPLKPRKGMAPFDMRLSSAQKIADDKRIIATDIEAKLGQRFTIKTIELLKKRFPYVEFVWLMGADGLAFFNRWKNWKKIARLVPIAVFPRPGSISPALRGAAASVLRHYRIASKSSHILSQKKLPAWTFLLTPQLDISATQLREIGHFYTEPIK